MSDPSAAFLDGMKTVLQASAALATAMGQSPKARVLVERPAGATADNGLPYILIGDDQIIGDDVGCSDNSEIFSTVHIYAQSDASKRGSQRAREVGAVLRPLLKDGFTITGHSFILAEFTDMRFLTDPAGPTHAVLTFHYRTAPAA